MKEAKEYFINLKRAYRFHWSGSQKARLVDSANNNKVIIEGSYQKVWNYAVRRGLTHS